jgi:hypothetical protein
MHLLLLRVDECHASHTELSLNSKMIRRADPVTAARRAATAQNRNRNDATNGG